MKYQDATPFELPPVDSFWLQGKRIDRQVRLGISPYGLTVDDVAPQSIVSTHLTDKEREVIDDGTLLQIRQLFDTLDTYDEQLEAGQQFLTEKSIPHSVTDHFRDLVVPSGIPGHYHLAGFNRFEEARLHEPAPPRPYDKLCEGDKTIFLRRIAELVKTVVDIGGSVSIEHDAVHLSRSCGGNRPHWFEDSPSARWLFFFHRSIWKYYDKAPSELVNQMKWVLENVNGAVVSIVWDDRNSPAEWKRQLSPPPSVLLDLSHGRIVDGESTILLGTDKFGRPTDMITAEYISDALSGGGAPKWVLIYACHSLETNALSSVFREAGTSTVLGWNERTAAFTEKVDRVCQALLVEAHERNETFAESLQRMQDEAIIPVDVIGTQSSLLVHGDADIRWWE